MICNLLCEGPNAGHALTLTNVTDILDLNGFSLTIGKSGVASDITGSGYIKGSPTSSISILGAGAFGTLLFDQTTPGTTNVLKSLTIDRTGSGSITLGNSLNVVETLTTSSMTTFTIAGSKVLTINPTCKATFNGTLTNSAGAGGLIVESGGSLITNGSVLGSATIKREIANDSKWHFLSSPVSGQNICDGNFASTFFNSTAGATYDFYKWSEPNVSGNLNWLNLKNADWSLNTTDFSTTPNFEVGKGYLVAYVSGFAGSSTKAFAGSLTTGDQTIALTTEGNTYNLIGNPFPSAINWDDVTKTNLANGYYYVYNEGKDGGAGYDSYLDNDHKTTKANGKISATQGFFVKALGSSLVLPNNARVHDNNWMKSSQSSPVNQLKLTVGNSTNYDEAFIQFDAQSAVGKDFYDAEKFFSLNTEIPQLYTLVGSNQKITINSMPFETEPFSIPLGMYIPADGVYSLNVTGIESFTNLPGILLKDTKLNTFQDLTLNPAYEFTAAKTDDPNRFVLSFNDVTLGTNIPALSKLRVYSTTGKINISGMEGKAEVLVRNMMGQVVMRNSVNGEKLYSVNSANLPAGVYVVSVVSGRQTVSEKIVVK